MDKNFLRSHLVGAAATSVLWFCCYVGLFLLLALTRWPLFLAILLMAFLFRWAIFPWLVARWLLVSKGSHLEPQSNEQHDKAVKLFVARSADHPIGELGLLVRTASFSIDTSKRSQNADVERTIPVAGDLVEEIYSSIENQISQYPNKNFWTSRVVVKGEDEAQPGSAVWGVKTRAWPTLNQDLLRVARKRLIIFGASQSCEGLAAVEFEARDIAPHLAFDYRSRWRPPFKNNIQRFQRIAKEKPWWRLIVHPAFHALIVALIFFFSAFLVPLAMRTAPPDGFKAIWLADSGIAAALQERQENLKNEIIQEIQLLDQKITSMDVLLNATDEQAFEKLKDFSEYESDIPKAFESHENFREVTTRIEEIVSNRDAYDVKHGKEVVGQALRELRDAQEEYAAAFRSSWAQSHSIWEQKKADAQVSKTSLQQQLASLKPVRFPTYSMSFFKPDSHYTGFSGSDGDQTDTFMSDPFGFLAVTFARLSAGFCQGLVNSFGVLGPAVGVLLGVELFPLLVLSVIMFWRLLRYLVCLVHSYSGTFIAVRERKSLAYAQTSFKFDDEFESQRSAVAFIQIVQGIIFESVIDVLKKNNVDTNSLRQELQLFVNEGIYMSGGIFNAKDVSVGMLASIFKPGRRAAARSIRHGQAPLVNPSSAQSTK